MEWVAHSPGAHGAYNLAPEKAILVSFALIFSRRGESYTVRDSHTWDGHDMGSNPSSANLPAMKLGVSFPMTLSLSFCPLAQETLNEIDMVKGSVQRLAQGIYSRALCQDVPGSSRHSLLAFRKCKLNQKRRGPLPETQQGFNSHEPILFQFLLYR